MSLVNDALKRAKEAQQPTPAPPISGPPFQEVAEPEESGNWIKSPVTMVVVAIIALVVIWQSLHHNRDASRGAADAAVVAARSNVAQDAAPAATQPQPEPQPPAAAPVTLPSPPAPKPAEAAAPAPTNAPVTTAESQPAAVTAPAPPSLKLQAVIWNPKRPSAIINGQTVFVGDEVRGLRVSAITRDTATLGGTAKPEVLRLTP